MRNSRAAPAWRQYGQSSADAGVTAPVIAGGIIPEEDRPRLLAADVAAVYTPKDFELPRIMAEVIDLAIAHRG